LLYFQKGENVRHNLGRVAPRGNLLRSKNAGVVIASEG